MFWDMADSIDSLPGSRLKRVGQPQNLDCRQSTKPSELRTDMPQPTTHMFETQKRTNKHAKTRTSTKGTITHAEQKEHAEHEGTTISLHVQEVCAFGRTPASCTADNPRHVRRLAQRVLVFVLHVVNPLRYVCLSLLPHCPCCIPGLVSQSSWALTLCSTVLRRPGHQSPPC